MGTGRKAHVLGELWRNGKVMHANNASLGLLLRIISFCADRGKAWIVSETELVAIDPGDTNRRRSLNELLDAGLVDRVDGGYEPHEWWIHNPGLDVARDRAALEKSSRTEPRRDELADASVTSSVTSGVTSVSGGLTRTRSERDQLAEANVKFDDQQNQQLESTHSDPRPRTQEEEKKEDALKRDVVFDHWVTTMGLDKSMSKLNAKRREKLRARRREGYSDETLCQAIDGCKLSEFHMGKNDRGQKYNELATILRDGSTVESHAARAAGKAQGPRITTAQTRVNW